MPLAPPPDPVLYRPNVAAILRNSRGEIFIAERLNNPDAWQFPQGGVDEGEDHEQAMLRELHEEIGVTPNLVRVMERRDGYRYAFPEGRLKYGLYGGQEQTYFLCDYVGSDADIRLDAHEQEFGQFRWITPRDFQLQWVPKFKRAVYRDVLTDFFGVKFE